MLLFPDIFYTRYVRTWLFPFWCRYCVKITFDEFRRLRHVVEITPEINRRNFKIIKRIIRTNSFCPQGHITMQGNFDEILYGSFDRLNIFGNVVEDAEDGLQQYASKEVGV